MKLGSHERLRSGDTAFLLKRKHLTSWQAAFPTRLNCAACTNLGEGRYFIRDLIRVVITLQGTRWSLYQTALEIRGLRNKTQEATGWKRGLMKITY